jgi:hypothetical protein
MVTCFVGARPLPSFSGGTRGESLLAIADGRILVARTGHVDEITPRRAPAVQAVPDGALLPPPMRRIGVFFDHIAEDFESDQIFWRLPGSAGEATITLDGWRRAKFELANTLLGLRADDAIRVL